MTSQTKMSKNYIKGDRNITLYPKGVKKYVQSRNYGKWFK